ncbi:unnamed protein product [Clonostachys rosea]|uniref:ATP-dependent DNA helicase n=1 Tax=Bionectria ochroleuca TaxID=29856 RepID=A0ABY6UU09_BIOOC|nr:unnamed protein product [Clonostachys rosea]
MWPPNSPPESSHTSRVDKSSSGSNDDPQLKEQCSWPLTQEQQDVIDEVAAGNNVFYTGSAGSGKSTLISAIVKKVWEMGKSVQVIAPSRVVAALHPGGMTVERFLGHIPNSMDIPINQLLHALSGKSTMKVAERRRFAADVLIIDEINMVSGEMLERINHLMTQLRPRKIRRADIHAPCGGAQLVVTGNFGQLPPTDPFRCCFLCGKKMRQLQGGSCFTCPSQNYHGGVYQESQKWAFKSNSWDFAKFDHVHLNEIHRQTDFDFVVILQKFRLRIPFTADEVRSMMEGGPKLSDATREDLDKFFEKHRHTEDGFLKIFSGDQLRPVVRLREGMNVILQVNVDKLAGLCNGSQGRIVGFEPFNTDRKMLHLSQGGDRPPPFWLVPGLNERFAKDIIRWYMERNQVQGWPRVEFKLANGELVTRTIRATFQVESFGGRLLLGRARIPLLPGWAITVPESQGMTIPRVALRASDTFGEGQMYTTMSRAPSLNGLTVIGNPHELPGCISDDIRKFLTEKFGTTPFMEPQLLNSYGG